MKIAPIQNFNLHALNKTANKKQNISNPKNENEIKTYSFNVNKAMFFLGGYSLNLKDTIKSLDKLDENLEHEIYPNGVRNLALEEIEKGNPNNKTLIDIHKERYKLLEGCYSLDEAKRLYPEFKNVLSDKEIQYQRNSFIDKVKQGQIEFFNPDEDLSLQILKFYWGEGLSLNGLKDKTDNMAVYSVFKKLNIPTVSKDYGHILKLSDANYNKRLTQEIAKKKRESLDRKEQKEKGLPVYIPKGPMSQEHKDHISQGLLKYYTQKRLIEGSNDLTKEEKEYYIKNPEQAERMSKAMKYAWRTHSGSSVKKHMIKFFKKYGANFDEIEKDIFVEKSKKQQMALIQFWQKNGWAKECMSKAVKEGWERLRKEELEAIEKSGEIQEIQKEADNKEEKHSFRILPKPIFDNIERMIKNKQDQYTNGYIDCTKTAEETFKENLCKEYFYNQPSLLIDRGVQTSLFLTMLNITNSLKENRLPYDTAKDKKFVKNAYQMANGALALSLNQDENKFTIEVVLNFLRDFGKYCYDNKHPEMLDFIEERLDTSYELYKNKDNSKEDMEKFLKYRGNMP